MSCYESAFILKGLGYDCEGISFIFHFLGMSASSPHFLHYLHGSPINKISVLSDISNNLSLSLIFIQMTICQEVRINCECLSFMFVTCHDSKVSHDFYAWCHHWCPIYIIHALSTPIQWSIKVCEPVGDFDFCDHPFIYLYIYCPPQ